jgi:hypothetical protein
MWDWLLTLGGWRGLGGGGERQGATGVAELDASGHAREDGMEAEDVVPAAAAVAQHQLHACLPHPARLTSSALGGNRARVRALLVSKQGLLSLPRSSPPRTDLGHGGHDPEVVRAGALGTGRPSAARDGS